MVIDTNARIVRFGQAERAGTVALLIDAGSDFAP